MLKEGDLRVRAVLVSILLIGIALLIAGLVINGPITGNAISEGVVEKGITGMSLLDWIGGLFGGEDGEVMLAPVPISVSGNIIHGETITIQGSGFGVKPINPNTGEHQPLIYDDMENGVFNDGWRTTHNLAITSNDNRHSFSSYNAVNDYSVDTYGFFEGNPSMADTKFFVQYWFNLDDTWVWGTGADLPKMSNIKFFRVMPEMENLNFAAIYHTFLGGNRVAFLSENIIPQQGADADGPLPLSIEKEVWHSQQFEWEENSAVDVADGKYRYWYDGLLESEVLNIITRTTALPYLKYPYIVGGWFSSWGTTSTPVFINIDDVYVDNTWARIELCDVATWSEKNNNGALCELQIPQTWSDGSITFQANQGTFQDGETAYLYVVDEDGVVNEVGYEVGVGNPIIFQDDFDNWIDIHPSDPDVLCDSFDETFDCRPAGTEWCDFTPDTWSEYGKPDDQIMAHGGRLDSGVYVGNVESRVQPQISLIGWLPEKTHDELYYRWYIKYNETWSWWPDQNGQKLARLQWNPDSVTCGQLTQYAKPAWMWGEMYYEVAGEPTATVKSNPQVSWYDYTTNGWMLLEVYIKLNDIGVANGVKSSWINGKKVLHNDTLLLRTDPNVHLNKINLPDNIIYTNQPGSSGVPWLPPEEKQMWMDDLIVSTSYVGPESCPDSIPINMTEVGVCYCGTGEPDPDCATNSEVCGLPGETNSECMIADATTIAACDGIVDSGYCVDGVWMESLPGSEICEAVSPNICYYVDASPTGCAGSACSDTNDGLTEDTAFATPQGCIDNMAGGDHCLIKNGTYWRTSSHTQTPGFDFCISGTEQAYTTVKNFPGHRPKICSDATCSPNPSHTSIGTNWIPYDCSYIIFEGLEIDGGLKVGRDFGFDPQTGQHNIIIRNNIFRGGWAPDCDGNYAPLVLGVGHSYQVDHNYFYDMNPDADCGSFQSSSAGIKMWCAHDSIIEYNTILGDNLVTMGIDDKDTSYRNIHRYNRISDVIDTSIRLNHQDGGCGSTQPGQLEVYGNLLENPGREINPLFSVDTANIHHNTFIGGSPLWIGAGFGLPPVTNIAFKDNIAHNPTFYDSGEFNILVRAGSWPEISTFDIDYNIYDSDANYRQDAYGVTDTTYNNLADWRTASNQDTNSQEAVCSFVDEAGGDYHITDATLCKTASSTGGEVGAYGVTDCVGHLCGQAPPQTCQITNAYWEIV